MGRGVLREKAGRAMWPCSAMEPPGERQAARHRVDIALDVDSHVAIVRLLEDTDDVEDRVRRRDVREEGVAEALARRRALNQAGNVHDLQGGG